LDVRDAAETLSGAPGKRRRSRCGDSAAQDERSAYGKALLERLTMEVHFRAAFGQEGAEVQFQGLGALGLTRPLARRPLEAHLSWTLIAWQGPRHGGTVDEISRSSLSVETVCTQKTPDVDRV
jgi:hypothetical protein